MRVCLLACVYVWVSGFCSCARVSGFVCLEFDFLAWHVIRLPPVLAFIVDVARLVAGAVATPVCFNGNAQTRSLRRKGPPAGTRKMHMPHGFDTLHSICQNTLGHYKQHLLTCM